MSPGFRGAPRKIALNEEINQTSQRARLTRLIWLERARTALPFALMLALILVLFAGLYSVYTFDPYAPSEQVTGTLIRLHQVQSEVPRPPEFVVELKSGAVVTVHGTREVLFRKGERMVLQEYVSRVLGRRSYRFVRYLDGDTA